ncbi:MAG TPA: ester cyclase [Ktedonobacterales bacterium]|nr:ester cyclase [Ktedonobacterales bacterium]
MTAGPDYEAILRRYIRELWQRGNLAIIDELTTPDYKRYAAPGAPPLDRAGHKERVVAFREAFPDLAWAPQAFVIQGVMVAFHLVGTATHRGTFQGVAATGRPVTMVSIDIVRFDGDKMAEHWGARDDWSILRQLGARLADP